MAEAFNSLFKAECIRNPVMRPHGGWKSLTDVELAVAEYIDWLTTDACTASSDSSRPPSTSRSSGSTTTLLTTRSKSRPEPGNRASTEPGAIQLEMLRAAIKRGLRDKLIDEDPTERLVVSLGHKELPHWTSAELLAVIGAAPADLDDALLRTLGLMGLRPWEARVLTAGDLRNGYLSVLNSGGGSDTTKTRASRRSPPVPANVLGPLERQAGDRPSGEWLFPSPRKAGQPIAERYIGDVITCAVGLANQGRGSHEQIKRIHAHGLRHTFAYVALAELGADLLTVSTAMGHARPSITLDRYGHFSPKRLGELMTSIYALATREDQDDAPQMRPGEDVDPL